MKDKLLSISQAADILGVHQNTLRNWDEDGTLKSVKTFGGHRRYKQSDIDFFVGISDESADTETIVATYSRVSSHDQKKKGDLDRQSQRLSEHCAKKKYNVRHIIKDVGSGLSDTRSGFNKLMDLVIARKVTKVVIEYKDRLTRFQYNLIVKFFNSYDVEVECIGNKDISEEEEFVNDMMMLMASFSGKLYGKRSAKRRKEKQENIK